MMLGPFKLQLRSRTAPLTVEDWRRRGRRSVPGMVWAYVENGADAGRTLAANEAEFKNYRLRQRVLTGVSEVDLSATIAGLPLELPILVAPTGLMGSVHWQADIALARAAEQMGTRLVSSSASSYSLEEIAAATREDHWFQLYPWGDRELMSSLMTRARHAGFGALQVTVDVPVIGNRLGEQRLGMGVPPVITPSRALRAASHPAWTYRYLRHRRVALRNLAEPGRAGVLETVKRQAFNLKPDLAWADVAWMRDQWEGPLFVKGILDAEDAQQAVAVGADGVVISNHGGRQLDATLGTLEVLPEIAARVGERIEILVDGGIRSGADVIIALSLGATGVMLGRPLIYGLAGAGEDGARDVLRIIADEMRRNMIMMGKASVKDLGPDALIRREPR